MRRRRLATVGQDYDADTSAWFSNLADLSEDFYCNRSSNPEFAKLIKLSDWVKAGGGGSGIGGTKRVPNERNFKKFYTILTTVSLPEVRPLIAMCEAAMEKAYSGRGGGKPFGKLYNSQVCVANSIWSSFAQAVGYYQDKFNCREEVEEDLPLRGARFKNRRATNDREFTFRHIRQLARLIEHGAKDIVEFVDRAVLRPDLLTDNEAETMERWLEEAYQNINTIVNEQKFRQRGGSIRRRRRLRR